MTISELLLIGYCYLLPVVCPKGCVQFWTAHQNRLGLVIPHWWMVPAASMLLAQCLHAACTVDKFINGCPAPARPFWRAAPKLSGTTAGPNFRGFSTVCGKVLLPSQASVGKFSDTRYFPNVSPMFPCIAGKGGIPPVVAWCPFFGDTCLCHAMSRVNDVTVTRQEKSPRFPQGLALR